MSAIYDGIAEEYIENRGNIPDVLLSSLKVRDIDFKGAKIADFGAGPGFLSDLLSEEGGIVDAVEPAEAFISYGKDKFKNNNKVNFNLKYAEESGLPSKTYDIVFVLSAWHWFKRADTIEEAKRILKPGGYLIIGDINIERKAGMVKDTMKIIKHNRKKYKVDTVLDKEKNENLINSFPVRWIKEWQDHNFDIRDLYKKKYKVEFDREEWVRRLGTHRSMVEFKKKHRQKILKKINGHLKDHYKDEKYKVHHELNVVVLKNKIQ